MHYAWSRPLHVNTCLSILFLVPVRHGDCARFLAEIHKKKTTWISKLISPKVPLVILYLWFMRFLPKFFISQPLNPNFVFENKKKAFAFFVTLQNSKCKLSRKYPRFNITENWKLPIGNRHEFLFVGVFGGKGACWGRELVRVGGRVRGGYLLFINCKAEVWHERLSGVWHERLWFLFEQKWRDTKRLFCPWKAENA